MVSLTLWPVATVFSLVPVPFVVVYVTAAFIIEALFVTAPLCGAATGQTPLTRPDEILTRHTHEEGSGL